MDFRFDADDLAMITGIAESLKRHLPLARFRSADVAASGLRALAADGWLHAGLPAQRGGLDVPAYLLCAFAREAGRGVCVEEWTNNAQLLPRLIATIADASVRDAWLAHQRAQPGFLLVDGRAAGLRAREAASAPREAAWCYGAAVGLDAYALLRDGPVHVLRRHAATGVVTTPVAGLAVGVAHASVGAEAADARLDLDQRTLDAIATEALLIHSAGLAGVAEQAEALTVEYVKIREQFGQPIGKFQAVKHILADVHVQNEVAANAVFYAALSAADDRAPRAARLQATQAALTASRTMVQLHGGFGFTWEADVHWFLKTALSGAARFGSRDAHALALGRAVLAGA